MDQQNPQSSNLDPASLFEARKRDHIQNSLDPKNEAAGLSGLERVRLTHESLPNLDLADVSLSTRSLGLELRVPLFVSSMTAGHQEGRSLNRTLARACAERGWMMGVGSQRRQLFDHAARAEWLELRNETPDVVLLGNLGLAQVVHTPVETIREIVQSLEAAGLIIHLNPLQECIQPEGTPQFRGGLDAIAKLVDQLGLPVIVKETGCGMSAKTMARLSEVGVAAIDVAGLGGTHWGRIEGSRGGTVTERLAQTFSNWGHPTVDCLLEAKNLGIGSEVWASGGIRTGLDAAKCLALGANMVGFAKPALQNALAGESSLVEWMKLMEQELRIALFCTGSGDLKSLKGKYGLI